MLVGVKAIMPSMFGMFIIKLFKIKALKYSPQVKFLLYGRPYK